jgi:hypothetical protein
MGIIYSMTSLAKDKGNQVALDKINRLIECLEEIRKIAEDDTDELRGAVSGIEILRRASKQIILEHAERLNGIEDIKRIIISTPSGCSIDLNAYEKEALIYFINNYQGKVTR